MRWGLVDLGMADRPSCGCQRSMTWAGVFEWAAAIRLVVSSWRVLRWSLPSCRKVIPPIGDHAWVRMPCSAWKARTSRRWKEGCSWTWLTEGTTSTWSRSIVRCSTVKLLTPIEGTLPSVRSFSSARYGPRVCSNVLDRGSGG